jgi:hypothetical protein
MKANNPSIANSKMFVSLAKLYNQIDVPKIGFSIQEFMPSLI